MEEQDHLPSTSNSNAPESESFEFIDSNTEVAPRENDDLEDLANESLGEDSESESDLGESDVEQALDDESDTASQRLARVRNYERYPFIFPANFHVMYIGTDVPVQSKHAIFSKISESLSQIFWDEAEGALNDIGFEKRLVVCPVSNIPQDGRPQVEYFQDSEVAICEADLTNGPYNKAFEFLQRKFAKSDQDSALIDLCVVFIPQDVSPLDEHFREQLLPTMKKLQEQVTLLPIINDQELAFRDEKEERRRAILKSFEDKGIEIFTWKADQMIQDRDRNGEWVETVYTKKVLFVNEFIKFENQVIYEDLQLLRSRAIEFRKDRLCNEQAKKKAQKYDRYAAILKEIIIKCMIVYTVYLFFTGVWNYAEWAVIPSDLKSSLQAVSRASLKTQNQNRLQTISLDNGETQPFIEVFQESSSRFVFNIMSKKRYVRNRKDVFEVIVTHHPPQILGRYDVQEIDEGRYAFEIDTSGSKGEVLVEIKEKNGSSIKIITWKDKGEDKKRKNDTLEEHKEEPTVMEYVQGRAVDAYHKVSYYSKYTYESAKIYMVYTVESIADAYYRVIIYIKHQLNDFYHFVLDNIDYLAPIIWDKVSKLKATTKEYLEVGYLKAEEVYFKVEGGVFNLARFLKDQYDEFYEPF
ncbi:13418_t:CDS:2 [Funneliformis geosporum]|uniref:19792_t:CDS:1 n=1 Tax=Funneliformis geosporum TaxID=1117311 RepID=A0A9W4WIV9_9GLOM|nr:19792_t:CDS:2 [Funneliformis geosporum]CAI2184409.1 13418_t:CDS:2 [Funneliformis geosporum]